MTTTSQSPFSTSTGLLRQMEQFDPQAWERFTKIYGGLVYCWGRQFGLSPEDASDLVQEVFQSVLKAINRYEHQSFRGWLWTITRNCVRDREGKPSVDRTPRGGSDFQSFLQSIPEPEELDHPLTRQSQAFLLRQALEQIRGDFEEHTWQAFWRLAVDHHPVAEIASDLKLTEVGVRQAKFRILRRLKEELGRI